MNLQVEVDEGTGGSVRNSRFFLKERLNICLRHQHNGLATNSMAVLKR
jgi:hypothetical protein